MPPLPLARAIAAASLALAACGGATSPTGAVDSGIPDATASAADAATPDAGDASCAQLTRPCDDGTGATDCCPASVVAGTACACDGLTCWSKCTTAPADSGGWRSAVYCTGSGWLGGHGLFPCAIGDL